MSRRSQTERAYCARNPHWRFKEKDPGSTHLITPDETNPPRHAGLVLPGEACAVDGGGLAEVDLAGVDLARVPLGALDARGHARQRLQARGCERLAAEVAELARGLVLGAGHDRRSKPQIMCPTTGARRSGRIASGGTDGAGRVGGARCRVV